MSGKTTPWRTTVAPPRAGQRETSLYLRSRRWKAGREEEERVSAWTTDPAVAEQRRAAHEARLNAGGRTLPAIMDARIVELEREAARGTKSERSVEGFKLARKKIAMVLDVEAVDRAAFLRARDALNAMGLGAETVNTYLRRAAACWRWAEERGLVSTPWPKIKAQAKPPRKKRPYTPSEVEAVLGWVKAHRGGRWLGLLSLVDETGRRVSEVCRLRGRDVDRKERVVRLSQKGRRVLVLPITDATLALLPERKPDEWLFPRPLKAGGVGPARRDVVRGVVRRAIRALKIPDGARLDTHSFRRSFAAHAHRAGVPDQVAQQLGGWETRAMLAHYQQDDVSADMRGAQDRVRDYRATERARTSLPPASPASPAPTDTTHGQRGTRTPDPLLVRSGPDLTDAARTQRLAEPAPGEAAEASRDPEEEASPREDLEALVVAMWADQSPRAMRRLIRDVRLQVKTLAKLDAIEPEDSDAESAKVSS